MLMSGMAHLKNGSTISLKAVINDNSDSNKIHVVMDDFTKYDGNNLAEALDIYDGIIETFGRMVKRKNGKNHSKNKIHSTSTI